MKYHNNDSYATDALKLKLDINKLKILVPEITTLYQRLQYLFRKFGSKTFIERIEEHINFGDSQGAIVLKTNPLLIAAYNSDIDCVVMLWYNNKIQEYYNFNIGDKLICINTFDITPDLQADLIPGPGNRGIFTMVHPIIADLVSSSAKELEKRKNAIGDEQYKYIWNLAQSYFNEREGYFRNGKPFLAAKVKFIQPSKE